MRQKFTIIELLVVIAIIAILAAMLLPSLSQARDTGKKIACVGNLKQMGIGAISYGNDYKDWSPVSNYGGASYRWRVELYPYTSGTELNVSSLTDMTAAKIKLVISGVFSCPAKNKVIGVETSGYGWNRGDTTVPNMGFGYSDDPASANPRRKLSEAKFPSESVLCGDSTDWWSDGNWSMAYMLPPSYTWAANPTVGNRHQKGINGVWADGHVEWKRQSEMKIGKNGDSAWFYMRKRS